MSRNQPQDDRRDTSKTIIVTGFGKASAKLGQTKVRLGVSTEAITAAEALARNVESMNRVMEALKKSLPDAKVETSSFDLHPKSSPPRGELVGFQVFHTLVVPINDIGEVGEIVDKAVRAGANIVNVSTFTSEDDSLRESRNLAMERALLDARTKAEGVPKVLGVKIIGILSALEEVYPYGGGHAYRMPAPAFAAPMGTQIMPPTESEVRVTVRVTFAID